MSSKSTAWLLFGVQLACAGVFGFSQFEQMLSSTQGVSMSWLGAFEIFLFLNLWLAWRAHGAKPSLVTGQTVIVYGFYALMIGLDLSVVFLRRSWSWTAQDTLTAVLISAGVVVTLVIGVLRGARLAGSLMRGWFAVSFKAVPQFVLAWSIYIHGGSGLALGAVVSGHVTILSRLAQLSMAIREAGWDKNRLGSFISEIPNELSWIAVTFAWVS